MKKSAETKLPISINIQIAGKDQRLETDNILKSLRELTIDPNMIKSRSVFEVNYKGEIYRKALNVIQTKRLLTNDLVRKITAKSFNLALGVPVNNYD